MKLKHILLIVGTISAALFSSCKKYDDGPRLSLHTKKARVVNAWKFDEVIENGNNVTASGGYQNLTLEFKKDGAYTVIDASTSYNETGTWQFASDKEDLILTPTNQSDGVTWIILKLKNKEFWVRERDGSYSIEYHLLPK